MLSRLDIEDERDRENELSNLSTRPVDGKVEVVGGYRIHN